MDFLSKNKTTMHLQEGIILRWLVFPGPEEYDADIKFVRLICHRATLPPNSAVLVSREADARRNVGEVTEGSVMMLHGRGTVAERPVVSTRSNFVHQLITNSRN